VEYFYPILKGIFQPTPKPGPKAGWNMPPIPAQPDGRVLPQRHDPKSDGPAVFLPKTKTLKQDYQAAFKDPKATLRQVIPTMANFASHERSVVKVDSGN